jgi:hypothetical protein
MTDHRFKLQRIGILTSYIVGLPIGLTTIAMTLLAPTAISGEGLPTMGLIAIYGNGILGLIVAFVFALWYAGKSIAENLASGNLLSTSFKYSLNVNIIIWTVFILLTIFQNSGLFTLLLLIPPIIAFIISVLLTTISIGLLICWIVEVRSRQIEKPNNLTYHNSQHGNWHKWGGRNKN